MMKRQGTNQSHCMSARSKTVMALGSNPSHALHLCEMQNDMIANPYFPLRPLILALKRPLKRIPLYHDDTGLRTFSLHISVRIFKASCHWDHLSSCAYVGTVNQDDQAPIPDPASRLEMPLGPLISMPIWWYWK